ncbi:DUF1465 family protein [Novosphingopyxis sp.]|uniref:DUF1465 family protein n=1 Tax=Novosphingopyxis sp. TaxID=2709690 RepID=UPI003B5A0377
MFEAFRSQTCLTSKLIDALYCEALVLADEARSAFGDADHDLPARQTLALSCESLRVTTRLMQIIAWLLNHKAYRAGELTLDQLYGEGRALGHAVASDETQATLLPPDAAELARSSEELYYRVQRIAARLAGRYQAEEPVHGMMDRIERAF